MKNYLLILSTYLLLALPASASEIVVGQNAGGPVDSVARIVQQYLNTTLQQNFVVINRPGADGRIATKYALDESTKKPILVLFATGTAFNRIMFDDPGYTYSDFDFVLPLATTSSAILVPATSSITTLAGLAEKSKKQPLNCGVANAASLVVAKYFFTQLQALSTQLITYKGSGEVIRALLGGDLDCALEPISPYAALARDGRLRIIGMGSPSKDYAAIPTYSSVLPKLVFFHWYGVAISKNMPAEQRAIISNALYNISKNQEANDAFAKAGLTVSIPEKEPEKWLERSYQQFNGLVPKQ